MDVFGSLQFFREILKAIQEHRSGQQDKLSDFLMKSNYFASVFSGILILDTSEEKIKSVKNDLNAFLEGAKIFIQENVEFKDWWPEEREGVVRQAFINMLSGRGNELACFTMIVAVVMESLRTIKNYETLQKLREVYIRQ